MQGAAQTPLRRPPPLVMQLVGMAVTGPQAMARAAPLGTAKMGSAIAGAATVAETGTAAAPLEAVPVVSPLRGARPVVAGPPATTVA